MNTINNPSPQPGQPHLRKIHYIDHILQKWLLTALVCLESIVVCIAGAILYSRLNTLIDESLYRVHFGDQTSIFSLLIKESMWVLAGLVAVNLVALLVADRIWSRYVRNIVLALRGLLLSSRDLDFGVDSEVPQRHKVVTLARDWRRAQRVRHLAIRDSIGAVATAAEQTSTSNDEFRTCLLEVREHLP